MTKKQLNELIQSLELEKEQACTAVGVLLAFVDLVRLECTCEGMADRARTILLMMGGPGVEGAKEAKKEPETAGD